MTVLPAIDLQGGRQVGLVGGDIGRARTYGDPVAFARARQGEGFAGLHVVDLDGAAAGRPVQLDVVRAIRAACPGVLIEAGGGVRSVEDALAVRAAGADRVVVGTVAVAALTGADPAAEALVRGLIDALGPEGVALALDGEGGDLAGSAWRERRPADLGEAARRAVAAGVRWVVHTDTGRDGSLAGTRAGRVRVLAGAGLSVVAGGGIGGDADLVRLAAAGAWGAIVGRAFHAGAWRPSPSRRPA